MPGVAVSRYALGMKRALGVGMAFVAGAVACANDGLLIVAPAELAGALGEFAEFKRERLTTTLVTLEDALAAGEGADDAERLKRYLYARWREVGVRYVLLVGDADVMPVRYMVLDRWTEPAFHYAFYPSDLYYADLANRDGSFEDWNGRTDGFHAHYFGEVRGETNKDDPINFDGVDYRPEVGLGRWPVSTPEEARLIAEKTMRHERAVERGEGEWLGRAGLVMVGGWVDARPRFEAVRSRLEPAWNVERMYYEGGAYGVAEPTEPGVVDLINGGVRLVLHAGHGNDDLWEHCLSVGSLERMRNAETLPVMMSAGCSTARFDDAAAVRGVRGRERRSARGDEQRAGVHRAAARAGVLRAGRVQPDGLGGAAGARGRGGGSGVHRVQHGEPAVRADADRRVRGRTDHDRGGAARGLLGARGVVLLRTREPGDDRADGELVPGERVLPGDEVHALRGPVAADAEGVGGSRGGARARRGSGCGDVEGGVAREVAVDPLEGVDEASACGGGVGVVALDDGEEVPGVDADGVDGGAHGVE